MKTQLRFQQLTNIRDKISLAIYKSGTELKNDIYEVIDSFWECKKSLVNDDLYSEDLTDLSLLHYTLIKEVTKLLHKEYSKKNMNLINNNFNFKNIINEADHSKVANKIYLFNKEIEYIIIGDLHSDSISLRRSLSVIDFFDKIVSKRVINIVFTGDYVDRGHEHLKLMEHILMLKYLFPKNIFLLRGNHDGGEIGINDELSLPYRVPEKDAPEMYFPHYLLRLSRENSTFKKAILNCYLDLFEELPYIAVIKSGDKTIMAVHGGIPRPNYKTEEHFSYLNSLADLTNNEITDFIGSTICNNLIWSDPYRVAIKRNQNSRRFSFTQQEFDSFRNKIGIDILVRGHESADDGYRYHFNNTAITIFSSGGRLSDNNILNTRSAYSWVKPKVLNIFKGKLRLF